MRFRLLLSFAGCLACIFADAQLVAQTAPRPNIILVMTDDQGWGDVEFAQELSPNPTNPNDKTYAGHPELKTPELAEMAQAGLQCYRFYAAAPVCSPTRASFLTGRSHRRSGIEHANSSHLYNRELTIAEIAASIGYETGHFGKWHLGTLDKSVHTIDSNRGGTSRADSVAEFSTPWGNAYHTTFSTESKTFTFNPTDISPTTHYWTGFEQYLLTTDPTLDGDDSEIVMDRVVPFIQNAVADGKPFVATIWLHTPHKPYTNLDIATLQNSYSAAELNQMSTNERGYYGSLTAMDNQIGRLRDLLRSEGIENDTLLMFTSDNGAENGAPGVVGSSSGNGLASGYLRGRKRDFYEGGIREPTIFEWPGKIAANTSTHALGGVIDLLPTLMDLWELQMPDDRPLDGESYLGVLEGAVTQRVNSMKFDYNNYTDGHFNRNPQRAIIAADGQFKAISNSENAPWELYDLIADPKETTNLASSNPTKLNELTTQWQVWRDQVEDHIATEIDYEDYIASSTGVSVDASEPSDMSIGQMESDTPSLIIERQMATLRSDLQISSDGAPATYSSNSQPTGGTIPAGTVVDSFLVHFDPTSTSQIDRSLTITFDNPILGVIGSQTLLAQSDNLAFANPTFSSDTLRGFDFTNPATIDGWSIAADGKTISIDMRVSNALVDELRIVTAATSTEIPTPTLLGDTNQDGVVNFLDISFFIATLSTGGFQAEADCNQDGSVTFLDISPFIAILNGQ